MQGGYQSGRISPSPSDWSPSKHGNNLQQQHPSGNSMYHHNMANLSIPSGETSADSAQHQQQPPFAMEDHQRHQQQYPPPQIGVPDPFAQSDRAGSMKSSASAEAERSAWAHYDVIKQFLSPLRPDEVTSSKQEKAREKLQRLSTGQFQELTTDVFDELNRRQNQTGGHYLPTRVNFHPKRNQARQKLSTLPTTRFRDLASDVMFELERRHPEFFTEETPPRALLPSESDRADNSLSQNLYYQRQPPSQQQSPIKQRPSYGSNTASTSRTQQQPGTDPLLRAKSPTSPPNSSRSEESPSRLLIHGSAHTSPSSTGWRPQAQQLNPQTHDDVAAAAPKSIPSASPSAPDPAYVTELEQRVSDFETMFRKSNQEIVKLQSELKKRPSADSSTSTNEVQRLTADLEKQRKNTDEVRAEMLDLLHEMQALIVRDDEMSYEKHKMTQEIHHLESQVRDWKSKYEQIRRNSQASLSTTELHNEEAAKLIDTAGKVDPKQYNALMAAISSLLQTAQQQRSANSSNENISPLITEIAQAIRRMSNEIRADPEISKNKDVAQLQSGLSTATTNLFSSARRFRESRDQETREHVVLSAQRLSQVVNDLVRIVKIRSSTPSTSTAYSSASTETSGILATETQPLDTDVTPTPASSSRFVEPTRRERILPSSSTESINSSNLGSNLTSPQKLANFLKRSGPEPKTQLTPSPAISSASNDTIPQAEVASGHDSSSSHNDADDKTETNLRMYLDSQTQAIVESIQSLLSAIRAPGMKLNQFTDNIDNIVKIVEALLSRSKESLPKISRLADSGGDILDRLGRSRSDLWDMRTVAQRSKNDVADADVKAFKQRLAKAAFNISRETKVGDHRLIVAGANNSFRSLSD